MNIYIIDSKRASHGTGVRTYIDQIRDFARSSEPDHFHLTFIDIEENESCIKNDKGVNEIHISGSPDLRKEAYSEYYADKIIEWIGEVERPLFHFNWIFHAEIAYFLKSKINCSIVLTKHYIIYRNFVSTNYDIFYHYHNNLGKIASPRKADLEMYHEYLNYANVDHFITVTEDAARVLQSLYCIEACKISKIFNGIETKPLGCTNGEDLKSHFGFSEKDFIITYVGAINQRKGILDFIPVFEELCERYDSLRLVIAGSGSFDLLFSRFKRFWSRVTFLGTVDKATLFDFHKFTDLGLLLSHAEQCSYAALEMMHHAIPLLVSNVDGLNEMVQENYNGSLVEVSFNDERCEINLNDVRNKVVELIEDNQRRLILGKNATKIAKENFCLESMIEKTFSKYQEIQAQCPSASPIEKISVVVALPANTEHLSKAQILSLQSLIKQSHSNIDVLFLVNSKIEAVVRNFLNSTIGHNVRSKIVQMKDEITADEAFVYALNKLELGKYVAFCNLSCIYFKNSFQNRLVFLEQNPATNLIVSNNFFVNSNSQIVDRTHPTDTITFSKLIKTIVPYNFNGFIFNTARLKKLPVKGIHHLCWAKLLEIDEIRLYPAYEFNVFQDLMTNRESNCKEETIQLISTQLEHLGVDFEEKELALQAILVLNFSNTQFISKSGSLTKWINKLEKHLGIDIRRHMNWA
ncbi:MAG: glycosyltransferase [Sphingobacterium sp.]|nr:glycosyltransferase [Sphingobacterium sp.]